MSYEVGCGYTPAATALSNLTNLIWLNLSANFIEDITPLSSLYELENLYLPINKIKDIEPLTSLKQLKILDLDRNEITNLESWTYYIPIENQYLIVNIRNNPLSDISIDKYILSMVRNGLQVR